MVLPTIVCQELKALLQNNAARYPKLMVPIAEGSEDSSPEETPNILIYFDFDEIAELDSKKIFPIRLPISLYIMYTSEEFETAAESFNNALLAILSILKIISGQSHFEMVNTINENEIIRIELQDNPVQILRKSAKGSSLQLALKYNLGV